MKILFNILAGLLAAAVLFVVISGIFFNRMVSRSVSGLLADVNAGEPCRKFSYADLEGLPEPVQVYFRNVLQEGQYYTRFVRLKQKAEMKTAEGHKWAPVEAEQYFNVDKPGFVWHAKVKPAAVLWFEARDMYYHGKGSMFVKLFSAITLVNSTGREMDEAALLRYLSETPWFPTALLPTAGKIKWYPVDADKAGVTFEDGGLSVSAVFYFNDQGEITRMEAMDRYNSSEKKKMKYTTRYSDYQKVSGVKIPMRGTAEWNFEDRDFPCIKVRITDIQYDCLAKY
ncbi:MAG: DUF6544 family protein [Bacillota bacterium]